MPCTMHPLHFNMTKTNESLKEIGDLVTHELDKIRDAVLQGETPDFSAYDPEWAHVIARAKSSLSNEKSGPSTGVLTDEPLLNEVERLVTEYVHIKSEWRKNNCMRILPNIERAQEEHRKEDIKRLMHHFIEVGDNTRLRQLLDVDPGMALKPQLGYDPDDF